ncbi:MAG: UDP-N-acetylmuramoyl-L-alanyl-D-glutamate--2,6-diaminopimelate ligase [Epsilonproteobacteria bacterium]|nr:UDP-N-acetylmuramoyl-L-alanyl-D-glutamate--2,6-diaminopimelate ligase [Campylobacterota bacterium]
MTVDFGGDVGVVTDDSRSAGPDRAFLATKLNRAYHDEAAKAGARLVEAAQLIRSLGLEDVEVVGVSGTNGKTTTAAAIYSLLLDLDYKAALQGTRGFFVNDEKLEEKSLTTPPVLATIRNLWEAKQRGAEFFVMEVSSHAIDQNRIDGLRFSLKVHTNVTSDHLDYHKTVENYRAVKSRFFSDESRKLINRDDEALKFNPKNAYGYALENPATYKVMAYTLGGGVSGVIQHFNEVATFETPLQGHFNLYNITAAIAAVHLLTGEDLGDICEAAENFGGVAGRMEKISDDPLVIVDFAHTEDGIRQVLDSLKEKELRVVFGAGGDRDRTKRPKMGAAAAGLAKKIYLTSDNPRSEDPVRIIDEIAEGIHEKEKVVKIVDRREAIRQALADLQPGEALLVLGKGDETYQEIGGQKIPFDDREVIRELLGLSK